MSEFLLFHEANQALKTKLNKNSKIKENPTANNF